MKPNFKLFILPILVVILACAPSKQSNLKVDTLRGRDLATGKVIELSKLDAKRVIINVYAPNCEPCVKEIPTLNYLHSEFSKDSAVQFYMAVDPTVLVDMPEGKTEEELFREAKPIVEKELATFGIQVPVVVMEKPFRISPEGTLATGTPETLLFKTNPLVLYYNFIGPISEEQDSQKLPTDPKVNFFRRMVGDV